jgi:hypothetical protein
VKRFERRLFKVPSLTRLVVKAQSLLEQKEMSNAEM